MELEANMVALTARFDDLVERIDRVQSQLMTVQTFASNAVTEARAVTGRFDHLNGSVGEVIREVAKIKQRCDRHEEDSGEIHATKAELVQMQARFAHSSAVEEGAAQERAKIGPWKERAQLVGIAILIILALLNAAEMLKHLPLK